MSDGVYTFENKGFKVSLNDKFLPSELEYENKKFKSIIYFDYEDVKIRIPVGYNILTVNLNDLKETLGVKYISDLIKTKG